MTETPDYRPTVFLPNTTFPMRGDLPKREPDLLARWDLIGLWQRTVDQMRGRPRFVLHDGPIYSNGNLHIGHALNRILKDVIMRAHRMAGEDAPYIPGWDTHGLPIEYSTSATNAAATASTGSTCRPGNSSALGSPATGGAATQPSTSAPRLPSPPRSAAF